MSNQSYSYFVPSGTSVKKLSQAEQQAVKSLFFNRGHRVMIHNTKTTLTAEWVNVAGKMSIKLEVDTTPLT